MTEVPPFCRVDPSYIRQMFNEFDYWRQAKEGQLQQQVLKDTHPSPPKANEPFCTRSMIIAYFDKDGTKLAIVHQYLRQDGNIGASGIPDPKWLFVNGSVLMPRESL